MIRLARLLLLAVATAAAVAISLASDITTFPLEYDVLTVTCELQVEALAGPVGSAGLPQVNELFQAFITAFNDDVKSGRLTVVDHNQRIDSFVAAVSAFVPNFKNESESAIANTAIDFFTFRAGAHAASWDVLYAASAAVGAQTGSEQITPLLAAVDTYMVQNIGTASAQDLQTKADEFFANAETINPGFRDLVYRLISHLYDGIWKKTRTDDATVFGGSDEGSADGTGSDDERANGHGEGSDESRSGSSSGLTVGMWDGDDFAETQLHTTHSPPSAKPQVDRSDRPASGRSASNRIALTASAIAAALVAFALHGC